MKKRALILLVLMVLPFMLGGSAPALADSPGKITGGVGFLVPQWGDLRIWIRLNVHEVDPGTHQAAGWCRWKIYSQDLGWRHVGARPTCVVFGEGDDEGTAVLVAQIVSQRGWRSGDYDEVGRYTKFWVRDGGTPGSAGDQWNMQSYQFDPWIEFWPEDEPPDCESFTPDEDPPIDVENGNLMIHP